MRGLTKTTLPKSTLGQAVTYLLNMWPKLRRCFDYAGGVVQSGGELDAACGTRSQELAARGIAQRLDPRWRPSCPAVESCRRLGVPVKDYLLSVLPGIAHRKLSNIPELSPARWASARKLNLGSSDHGYASVTCLTHRGVNDSLHDGDTHRPTVLVAFIDMLLEPASRMSLATVWSTLAFCFGPPLS